MERQPILSEPMQRHDPYFEVLDYLRREDEEGIGRVFAEVEDNVQRVGVLPSVLLHPHITPRKVALLAERTGRTREFAYLARKALDIIMIPEPHDDEAENYLRFVEEFNRSRRMALEEMARDAPPESPIIITALGRRIPYGERESAKHWKTYRYITYDGDLAPYGETARTFS